MWTESKLDDLLTKPSESLINDIKKIKGNIMLLGAGGKMGPTMCALAKNAIDAAKIDKKVIAVSRFSNGETVKYLEDRGIEVIKTDLSNVSEIEKLPYAENIIFMAGRKFGTEGMEWMTWGMNSVVPAFVSNKFKNSNFVVFSSGNIYPLVPAGSRGCDETVAVNPIGEYAMSCLARERVFEYAAMKYGTRVLIYRLNFAVDLRYGVLYDVAAKIMNKEPIPLENGYFNFIWQGKANEIAIRSLLHCSSPAKILNVTGQKAVSVRYAAEKMGRILGVEPIFNSEEGKQAFLSNASQSAELFGTSEIDEEMLMEWQAQWLNDGGKVLNKPTHFEETGGCF